MTDMLAIAGEKYIETFDLVDSTEMVAAEQTRTQSRDLERGARENWEQTALSQFFVANVRTTSGFFGTALLA